jgi:hypothetical protein
MEPGPLFKALSMAITNMTMTTTMVTIIITIMAMRTTTIMGTIITMTTTTMCITRTVPFITARELPACMFRA